MEVADGQFKENINLSFGFQLNFGVLFLFADIAIVPLYRSSVNY